MPEYVYLIVGVIVLSFTIYDFFFTTLSGSGIGFISEKVSIFSDKTIKLMAAKTGRKVYKLNGLFVNLMMLLIWIILVWTGLFLIFSFDPDAITNSNGRTANVYERLYYTGYIISTLGMGNFKPTSDFFEIITSCFSFFGFIFFTSSMTYFISVSSALVNKRTLSKSIFSLGKSPQGIADKLTALDTSYSFQQLLSLQEMIDRHSANHHAYPVIHFYTETKPKNCISLNLTRLDEALSILIGTEKGRKIKEELEPLRLSITDFLQTLDKKFSRSMPVVENPAKVSQFSYDANVLKGEDLENRRRILEELFRSEGLEWNDII